MLTHCLIRRYTNILPTMQNFSFISIDRAVLRQMSGTLIRDVLCCCCVPFSTKALEGRLHRCPAKTSAAGKTDTWPGRKFVACLVQLATNNHFAQDRPVKLASAMQEYLSYLGAGQIPHSCVWAHQWSLSQRTCRHSSGSVCRRLKGCVNRHHAKLS